MEGGVDIHGSVADSISVLHTFRHNARRSPAKISRDDRGSAGAQTNASAILINQRRKSAF